MRGLIEKMPNKKCTDDELNTEKLKSRQACAILRPLKKDTNLQI